MLSWTPVQVDCGYVPPGSKVHRQVEFKNVGPVPVELTNIHVLELNGFSVGATSLTIPAATKQSDEWVPGVANLEVTCSPTSVGPRQTQIRFDTNLPRQPTGSIPTKVFGGGPDIEVTPYPNLNFGKVAWFANATPPAFQKRKLTVLNVATPLPVDDVRANLRLGQPDPSTGELNSTWFKVVPLAGTSAGEFQISVPAHYDPAKGLEAKAGFNRLDLEVTFTPTSVGLKQAEVTIYSNDPDEPATKVLLSADAIVLPPCDYSVSATALSFGVISPPDYRDLVFTIKNDGTQPGDLCLLSGLDLTSTSDQLFTLPQGPIDSPIELGPNETKHVLVRAWAQGPAPTNVTNVTGLVEFFMSSPTQPVGHVNLTTQLGPSCLTIAPRMLEFGTADATAGCSGNTRQVRIYNRCVDPITVQAISSTSPNFTVANAPIGSGGTPLAMGDPPLTFAVTYAPVGNGKQTGAISLQAIQAGANVTYTLPVAGHADPNGMAKDTFRVDAPAFDVLFVIDDTVGGVQPTQLATAASTFAGWAAASGVDLHVAVTSSDMSTGGEQGRFISTASSPLKVLGAGNVAAQLPAKMVIGAGGFTHRCFAAAAAALTSPLVGHWNAGFLRNEAPLAIVCLGSQAEASPPPHGWYLDVLRNLKEPHRTAAFTFNAVSGFSSGCMIDDEKLAAAVDATGGFQQDICTLDWDQLFLDLAAQQARVGQVLELHAQPAPGLNAITVEIDGAPIPPTSWSYDATKNQIVFAPLHAPEPGKTVTVTYPVSCQP